MSKQHNAEHISPIDTILSELGADKYICDRLRNTILKTRAKAITINATAGGTDHAKSTDSIRNATDAVLKELFSLSENAPIEGELVTAHLKTIRAYMNGEIDLDEPTTQLQKTITALDLPQEIFADIVGAEMARQNTGRSLSLIGSLLLGRLHSAEKEGWAPPKKTSLIEVKHRLMQAIINDRIDLALTLSDATREKMNHTLSYDVTAQYPDVVSVDPGGLNESIQAFCYHYARHLPKAPQRPTIPTVDDLDKANNGKGPVHLQRFQANRLCHMLDALVHGDAIDFDELRLKVRIHELETQVKELTKTNAQLKANLFKAEDGLSDGFWQEAMKRRGKAGGDSGLDLDAST